MAHRRVLCIEGLGEGTAVRLVIGVWHSYNCVRLKAAFHVWYTANNGAAIGGDNTLKKNSSFLHTLDTFAFGRDFY